MRPSGWNHFFVVDDTDPSQIIIIDPSKGKIGLLRDTGLWDQSGINYDISCYSDIKKWSFKDHTRYHLATYNGKGWAEETFIPLLAPRHFSIQNDIPPFGFYLNLSSYEPKGFLLQVRLDDKKPFIDVASTAEQISHFFDSHGITVPKEVSKRIEHMWKNVVDNGQYLSSEKSAQQCIRKHQWNEFIRNLFESVKRFFSFWKDKD